VRRDEKTTKSNRITTFVISRSVLVAARSVLGVTVLEPLHHGVDAIAALGLSWSGYSTLASLALLAFTGTGCFVVGRKLSWWGA
jgi:hypothetical protein